MTLSRTAEPIGELSVDEALVRVLAGVAPLPPIEVELGDALGLALADDVVAVEGAPAFDNAAMDGFAVRSIDTLGAGNCSLRLIGTVAAGSVPTFTIGPGEAARIMTGAPIPMGADAVVRFEETDEPGWPSAGRAHVTIGRPVRAGENVRRAGEDIPAGSVALPAGTVLGPLEIGIIASVGRSSAWVHRRPVVGILSTGDEVVEPGQPIAPGQVRDSNAWIIQALVRQAGGEPRMLGIARDASADLTERLARGAQLDLIVTSGGVSVGDYDVVKDVLRARGAVSVWRVRMKPGRPLAFGRLDGTPILGLPGNPLAAFVAFLQFGRPLVRTLLGRRDRELPRLTARLTDPVVNRGGRRHFVRGLVQFDRLPPSVRPFLGRGSGVVSAASGANCLIVVPEDLVEAPAGSEITVQLLDPH